ncbi:MAG TPA: glycine--tRNA ligase subunit beta, partial [bacterium]|nr:glycine--tRNA ligase subunit beta [bacterium]
MKNCAEATLKEHGLAFSSVRTAGTYRRLVLIIEDVPEKSEGQIKELTGPPFRLLRDGKGEFTPQSLGFARAHGEKPENIKAVNSPKGEVMGIQKVIPGEPALKILSSVFGQIMSSLKFPKNMVWESSQFRFARPVRSIAALYGNKTVPLNIAGVKSGRLTSGLSALGSKTMRITDASKYLKMLEAECVIADPSARKHMLTKLLEQTGRRMKLQAEPDEALTDETVYLTEHPVPVTGHFSLRFLKLPDHLLSTVMKKQLKFFPVRDSDGLIQPHFIAIRDGVSDNQKEVQEGFQNVVEARLTDAVFFYEKDIAASLETFREKLKGIVFQEKLGTLYDKTLRVEAIVRLLCDKTAAGVDRAAAEEAASLCYCDLTSEVVREFPELQGYMGADYAER